jgi:hypothetical protein
MRRFLSILFVPSLCVCLLLAGCATPEDKVVGSWTGSGEIVMPPTGNKGLDAQLAKAHTVDSYTLELKKDKTYKEQMRNDTVVGTWKLDIDKITLTPTTVNGKSPDQVRKESEANWAALQIHMPTPIGTNGPEQLIVSQDFETITLQSIGTKIDLKKAKK